MTHSDDEKIPGPTAQSPSARLAARIARIEGRGEREPATEKAERQGRQTASAPTAQSVSALLAARIARIESTAGIETRQEAQASRGIYDGNQPAVAETSSHGFVTYERWENDKGQIHRDDGPAIVERDPFTGKLLLREWYQAGKRHRTDGPAYIYAGEDGGGNAHQSWWENGEMLPIVSTLERLRAAFGHKAGEGRKLPHEITPADEMRNKLALEMLRAEEDADRATRPGPRVRGPDRDI